jgi:hypothetical protein
MVGDFGIYTCSLEVRGATFGSKFTRGIVERLFHLITSGVKMRYSAVIGHIKGFCLGRKYDYLKISFVSDKGGVDVSGPWRHESERIKVTLNVIIFGGRRQDLAEIVNDAVKEIESAYAVNILHEKQQGPS